MRLIDADKVKQFPYSPESGTEDMVEEWIYECGLYDLELYVTDECPVDIEQALKDLCRKAIEGFMNIIDTEPTAYDVEKIVEELEERRAKNDCRVCRHFQNGKDECREDCTDALIDDLLDIVRKGGAK